MPNHQNDRRTFLKIAGATATASKRILGANERVQMAIIGTGARGTQVHRCFTRHSDVAFIGACDVAGSRLDAFVSQAGAKFTTYNDYRRVLDNKDIDAVLVSTPDHWHSPIMVDAVAAGKDVYVEKPVSNRIEPALKMVEAVRRTNRVVQVGIQQRSWHHFGECAKMVRAGLLGRINQCMILFAGGSVANRAALSNTPLAPPADLDWNAFQGSAPHHPYTQMRQRSWRNFWDYGGGLVTDWGVHMLDVVNWFMDRDRSVPAQTNAAAEYIVIDPPNPEFVPDTFSITWKFDKFLTTFTNAVPPAQDPSLMLSDQYGNYFFGEKGMMLVNRYGYWLKPNQPRRPMQMTPYGPVPVPDAPLPKPAFEASSFLDPAGPNELPDTTYGSATVRHTRNFLDCVKSRRTPVCDIETGFHSTLPCLLALESIRLGRSVKWDEKLMKAV